MKNKLSQLIAGHLPWRIMYFVIIRAWAYTTTHECSNKTPYETTWLDVLKSWENKTGVKV